MVEIRGASRAVVWIVSDSLVAGTVGRSFVPPAPPRTPKSAATRRRLLDVAAQLFIESGYSAVSMQDIAVAANLSKGAVYGHFRSKGQLLVEVIRAKIAERDAAPGFAEASTDLERGVDLIFDVHARELRLLEVDAAAAARHEPDVAAGLGDLYRERYALIRDGMSTLRDPETAAWLVGVLTVGIGAKEFAGLPLPEPDRLHAALVAMFRSLE